MRVLRGIAAIILCFVLLGLVPFAGAEESASSGDAAFEDLGQLFTGMDASSFSLENLFSEDVISGILGILLALFLSLFGVSPS